MCIVLLLVLTLILPDQVSQVLDEGFKSQNKILVSVRSSFKKNNHNNIIRPIKIKFFEQKVMFFVIIYSGRLKLMPLKLKEIINQCYLLIIQPNILIL